MQIEVGKYYQRRDGTVAKIVRNDGHHTYPWDDTTGRSYSVYGSEFNMTNGPGDLVREISPLSQTVLRQKTSAERKGEPIHSGVLKYFPDALAAVARVSKAGNDKHNPGEPLHWARTKSTDQMDAGIRHSLTPDQIDPDDGELEAAHMAWRVLAELQLLEEARLAAAGIKSYSGIVPAQDDQDGKG